MERDILEQHLVEAEAHVVQGERHLAEQRARISELERDGHDKAAEQARELLAVMLQSQQLHIRNRDRMRRELGLPGE